MSLVPVGVWVRAIGDSPGYRRRCAVPAGPLTSPGAVADRGRVASDGRARLRRSARRGLRPPRRRAGRTRCPRRGGHGVLPLSQRGRVEPRVHDRSPRPPAGRPRRRGPRPRAHRGHAQPHPHRGVPVAHRRHPGARPGVALRDRVAQAGVRGAAGVPHRRRRGGRGAGRPRRGGGRGCVAEVGRRGRRPGGPVATIVDRTTRNWLPPSTSRDHALAVSSSILDLIGNTPMVDVSALSPNPDVRIVAKLEGQNPAGSIKDRIAWNMVREAEADGTPTPGRTIIEPSSGNTGIALSMIARTRGYPIKIVMPENVSVERRQALEVWGAEIIVTPGAEGSNGAVRHARALADEHPEWAFLYQYANEANPRAHYEGTGPEIWRDCPEITHFVAGLGTTGTLMGVGRYLKEQNPAVQVLAVEPPLGELVEGLRNLDEGYIPPVFDSWGGLDLFDGISSGAAAAGAAKVAERVNNGTIVFIVCDGGWKYLSTGAYTDDLDTAEANAEKIIYF